MLVELIRSDDNKVIGWTMKGENPEEISKLGYIRDLQFWGNGMEYQGRKGGNDATNDPGTLSWVEKKE